MFHLLLAMSVAAVVNLSSSFSTLALTVPPPHASISSSRLSRRRQRTDEEQPPTSSHVSISVTTSAITTSSSVGSGAVDHITADFSQLSTLDTQQPAKRIHTETTHSPHNSALSLSPLLSSGSVLPFTHPTKPKPVKRRTARAAVVVEQGSSVDLQPQPQLHKAVAADQLALDDLLYDDGGGESEAEWESEHGSELRFLLDSLHVAEQDVQAGCMPYIL